MNKISYHNIREQRLNREKLPKKDGKASRKIKKKKEIYKRAVGNSDAVRFNWYNTY